MWRAQIAQLPACESLWREPYRHVPHLHHHHHTTSPSLRPTQTHSTSTRVSERKEQRHHGRSTTTTSAPSTSTTPRARTTQHGRPRTTTTAARSLRRSSIRRTTLSKSTFYRLRVWEFQTPLLHRLRLQQQSLHGSALAPHLLPSAVSCPLLRNRQSRPPTRRVSALSQRLQFQLDQLRTNVSGTQGKR